MPDDQITNDGEVGASGEVDNATWPSVSVVIATRNRPEMLRSALGAIADQDYRGEIETIVVFDQCDPDPSLEHISSRYSIRTTQNRRTPGLAGARNTGVDHASGELLAFCDDDDKWLPNKLRVQVSSLLSRPAADVVVGGIIVSYRDTTVTRVPEGPSLDYRTLLRQRVTAAHPSTILVRRRAWTRIGPVDEALPGSYGEDYEWLLRAARHHDIVAVAEPVALVRWGATSFFADRWETIVAAIDYLIEKHPDLMTERRGLARLYGRKAFAYAALGRRREARQWAQKSLRLSWRELRGYVAWGVSARLMTAPAVMRLAHSIGRGI